MCKNGKNQKISQQKNFSQWLVSSIIMMMALILYAPVNTDVKVNLAIIVMLIIVHKSQVVIRIDTANKAIMTYIIAILFLLWLAF